MKVAAAIPVVVLDTPDVSPAPAVPDTLALEAAGFRVFKIDCAAALPALTGRIVPDAVIAGSHTAADQIGYCRQLLASHAKLSDTVLVTPESDAMRLRAIGDEPDPCPWAQSPVAVLSAVHRAISAAQSLLLARTIEAGRITLDAASHQVMRDGHPIRLSPVSYRLIDYMARRPGRVFTRTQLLNAVWDGRETLTRRAVDVQMGRVRRALTLGPRGPIRTVTGAGYFFDSRLERGPSGKPDSGSRPHYERSAALAMF